MVEEIKWISPKADLPDEDITVIFRDQEDEVSCGFINFGRWYDLAYGIGDHPNAEILPPKFWAHMPVGPGGCDV